MYRNIVWFVAGYISAQHVVPVLKEALIRTHKRLKEDGVL